MQFIEVSEDYQKATTEFGIFAVWKAQQGFTSRSCKDGFFYLSNHVSVEEALENCRADYRRLK